MNNSNLDKSKLSYLMPLTKGSPYDGPSHCVFSSPKVVYSKETQNFVNVLMKESRLTTLQRNGFQSILRSGTSLPEKSDIVARKYGRNIERHAELGRALGLNIMQTASDHSVKNNTFLTPSIMRRSLDSIRASGDLDRPFNSRKYIPFDKEKEKDRLAHKMAYGNTPMQAATTNSPQTSNDKVLAKEAKSISEVGKDRFKELVEEIKDRIEFLTSMEKIGRGKAYHSYIVCQIKQKVAEMKFLNPGKAEYMISSLNLTKLDKSFVKNYNYYDNSFK